MVIRKKSMMVIFILLIGILTNINGLVEESDLTNNELEKSSSIYYHRFPRANDEEFTSSVDRIQKIARISNGIALQQGITNGTLPTDTVISELLNFGSIKPSEIQNIQTSELKELVASIQGFSKTLAVDDGITKIEKRLIMLGEIYKQTKDVPNVVESPKGYLEEAKKLKTGLGTLDWNEFEQLKKLFGELLKAMTSLETDEPVFAATRFSTIKGLVSSFPNSDHSKYKTALTSDILRDTKLFAALGAYPESIQSIHSQDNFYHVSKDPDIFSSLKTQMVTLGGCITSAKTLIPTLTTLKTLLVHRHHVSGNRALVQTAGFPNGFSDIDLISNDLTDPWTQTIAKDSSQSLGGAMDSLKGVGRDARAVHDSLGSRDSASSFLSIYNKLEKLSLMSQKFSSAADNLTSIPKEAQMSISVPKNVEEFVSVYGNITELANKLNAIDKLLTTASTLKTSPDLQFIIDKTATYSEENRKNLKDSKQYQDFFNTISSLSSSLAILEQSSSIEDLLDTVIEKYDQVDKYVNELDPFVEMVNTLRQTPELEMAEELIKGLRGARNVKIESFEPISKQIDDVKPKLTALEKSLKSKSPETKKLAQLKDMYHDSQVIGNSARVVLGIQKALGQKKIILEQAQVDLVQDPNFTTLKEKLDTFYKAALEFKSSMKTADSLLSISDVFNLARSIAGVPIDLSALDEKVRNLLETSNKKQELQEIKKILDDLDTFGLDFSKHQKALDESRKSLDSLDLFFTSFQTSSVITTPTPQNIGSTKPPLGAAIVQISTESTKSPTTSWIDENWYYLLFAGGLIGLGGAGGGWFWYHRKQKEKNKPRKFLISLALFQMFFSHWTLQFVTFQVKYQPIPSWPDTIRLYFMSFFAANSAATVTQVSKSVTDLAKCYRRTVPYSKNNRFEIKNNKKVKIRKGRVHGNAVTLPNKQVYWLTQIPQEESTVVGQEKEGNISAFWMGVVQKKSQFVMCLSPDADGKPLPYLPLELGTKKYDDGLTIKCTKIERHYKNDLVVRDLIVQFPKMRKHRVQHLHFPTWPNDRIPRCTKALVRMYQLVELSPYPVFISCSDGISKCGVFAQAVLHMQSLDRFDGVLAFGTSLNELRQQRPMCVSSEEDYMFVALLTFRLVVQATNANKMDTKTKADIKKFDRFIEEILEGKATLTMANLALHVPGSAPPVAQASKTTSKSSSVPAPPSPPLDLSRFPKVVVNREEYVKKAQNMYDESAENLKKAKEEKTEEKSKKILTWDPSEDQDEDVPLPKEEVHGPPTVEEAMEIPPPPGPPLDDENPAPIPNAPDPEADAVGIRGVDYATSETNVEMPEQPPPAPGN